MELKEILDDPEKAILKKWGSLKGNSKADEIKQNIEIINQLRLAVKSGKDNKMACSRRFKNAKENPERFEELKAEMQTLSNQLNTTIKTLKEKEKALVATFTTDEPKPASTPLQFSTLEDCNTSQDNEITVISADDKDAWNNYVKQHPNHSAYHYYEWSSLIQSNFGHSNCYLAAWGSKNNIVGVLPVIWLKSRLFGSFGTSMPYFNYGGPLADSKDIANQLLGKAAVIATEKNWEYLEIRTCSEQFSWQADTRKVSMILALPKTKEKLDKALGSKLRAQVKQAAHFNPEIAFGGKELLDGYYQVFSRNMRDLGTPVYSKAFFASILETFPESTRIVLVSIEQKPVSTAFLIGNQDMLEIPWASTIKSANKMNTNMWMYRQILDYALENDYQFFDFGRSTSNTGTYAFKKQWGAKEINHYWYNWLPEGAQAPELNPDNIKFRILIQIWKKLPIWFTKIIGPKIVKNLP